MKRMSVLRPKVPVAPSVHAFPLPQGSLSHIRSKVEANEERLDRFRIASRGPLAPLQQFSQQWAVGNEAAARASLQLATEEVRSLPEEMLKPPPDRDNRVAECFERLVAARSLLHIIDNGVLPMKKDFSELPLEDSEYLIGVISAVNDLSQSALRWAIAGDVESIAASRDITVELHSVLMEFDFRNGPLRKRYDGVKWGVRRLQDFLYEASLGEPHRFAESGSATEGVKVVDVEELMELKARMDEFDAKRELVIKGGRDIVKLAKFAVYSVHRKNISKAEEQLEEACALAKSLIAEHIAERPALRPGMFSGALEEWAEAVMFLQWAKTKTLPAPQDIPLVNDDEYLGGLLDFTGEVGRYAVEVATKRDKDAVEQCLAAVWGVSQELVGLNLRGMQQKVSQLRTNQTKIERLLYELALSQGGRVVAAASLDEPPQEEGEGSEG
eukprot:Hpha_TRINITY_DN4968_c0_g1::TRINITY_DN4968_c0_g1_i1::g.51477::m.51477